MDGESNNGRSLGLPLMLAGLAASMLAIFASGGLALLGGTIAAACLAGSVASSLASDPADEPCPSECPPATTVSVEVDSRVIQENAQGQRWQRAVAVSRNGCRRRSTAIT